MDLITRSMSFSLAAAADLKWRGQIASLFHNYSQQRVLGNQKYYVPWARERRSLSHAPGSHFQSFDDRTTAICEGMLFACHTCKSYAIQFMKKACVSNNYQHKWK